MDWRIILTIITLSRIIPMRWMPIADCDETFNYWEPLHQLLFGCGLQTWEYAPEYALRSWAFIWLHALPAKLLMFLSGSYALEESRPQVMLAVQGFISIMTSVASTYFITGAVRRFGPRLALPLTLITAVAPGFQQAAVAFLPSTFSMCCCAVAGGAWLRHGCCSSGGRGGTSHLRRIMICFVLLAVLLGWPFVGLLALPIALHVLVTEPFFPALLEAIAGTAVIVAAMFAIDSAHYCRPVVASLSIVLYNVFGGSERGPHLYGVEPWHFFFRNLAINFNVAFLAALAAPLACLASPSRQLRDARFTAPFFVWFAFWLLIPHKEERFMAPAFPFLALSAALTISALYPDAQQLRVGEASAPRRPQQLRTRHRLAALLTLAFLIVFLLLSFARVGALNRYRAPENIAKHFSTDPTIRALIRAATARDADVIPMCIGQLWHRFPSSFHVPLPVRDAAGSEEDEEEGVGTAAAGAPTQIAARRTIGFLRHPSFTGALPLAFAPQSAANATCTTAAPMNDLNREIPGQYVAAEDIMRRCLFIFDVLRSPDEPPQHGDDVRAVLSARFDEAKFLPMTAMAGVDAAATPLWCRVLAIPFLQPESCIKSKFFVLYANPKIYEHLESGGSSDSSSGSSSS